LLIISNIYCRKICELFSGTATGFFEKNFRSCSRGRRRSASLNPYSHRCAYNGVADLSVYIAREHRGKGIGTKLLWEIERIAIQNQFHKIVLFTFPFNEMGQRLYQKLGYEKVGIFRNQGKLDGKFVDVMAMEKLLV
jgi:L-amino acid N-acyltransferase YncA